MEIYTAAHEFQKKVKIFCDCCAAQNVFLQPVLSDWTTTGELRHRRSLSLFYFFSNILQRNLSLSQPERQFLTCSFTPAKLMVLRMSSLIIFSSFSLEAFAYFTSKAWKWPWSSLRPPRRRIWSNSPWKDDCVAVAIGLNNMGKYGKIKKTDCASIIRPYGLSVTGITLLQGFFPKQCGHAEGVLTVSVKSGV